MSMFRAAFSRQALRRVQVRHNSSSSSTANKAGDTAKLAQQKASEALGSAQKVAEKGFAQFQSATGKVGEKAGDLLGGQCFLFRYTRANRTLHMGFVASFISG